MEALAQPYPLTAAQVVAFQAAGHVLLPGVASADLIAQFRPAIVRTVSRYSTETRPLAERDTYGQAFLQVMNLWTRDEEVKRFVLARRFAGLAAALLGVARVRLYHDQALFKEPQGGYTPWHQDQYYWPLDTDKTITMWMPLVDITTEMGVLAFASGSHLPGQVAKAAISDDSEQIYADYIAQHGFPVVQANAMRAGDATFHLGWTIHRAGANRSPDRMREIMTVIYYADGSRVTRPAHEHQQADLTTWLGGLPPGALAASPLNPVL